MNRLDHIQKTLLQNIRDNFLLNDVSFVLLDYNSSDGLEDWIQQDLGEYIDLGILTYYKTLTPQVYNRSHSRNMVFKLANSKLVCNLDADNYLGKGFASFMTNEFNTHDDTIFYTSDLYTRDIVGRVVLQKEDFLNVKGYNEIFSGYGFEDVELIYRLKEKGLQHKFFYERKYYDAIVHSHKERLSEESMSKNLDKIYLSYISPYETEFLLLKKDSTFEKGLLVNNIHLNANSKDSSQECFWRSFDEKSQVILLDAVEGSWVEYNEYVVFLGKDNESKVIKKEGNKLLYESSVFYEFVGADNIIFFSFLLIGAKNFKQYTDFKKGKEEINSNGFGKGIVYKNFDYSNPIQIL